MPRDRRLLAVLAVAALLRVLPWLWPHTFLGVQESDDGVYYAASALLLHGQLPYADYTIVHPPGIGVLLLPFAALGELTAPQVGLAAARVAVVLVALANTLLVHRLAQRHGLPARSAAALYALAPGAVVAEHTVLLEPFVTLLCLLALVALPRRPLLAGVLCAAGTSVKLFAGAYVLVLLVWLLRRPGLRRFLVGLGGGALAVFGPFAAADPQAFWHDVVVTQLRRPSDATDNGLYRVVDMVGLSGVGVVLGTLVLLVVATQVRRADRLFLGLLAVAGLSFALSPSYFPHYGAFLVPAVALVVVAARPTVVALVLVCFAVGSVVDVAQTDGQDDWSAVQVPDGACVVAELASYPIAAGVFRVPTDDCPGWVDGRGVAYTQSTDWPKDRDFYPDGFRENAAWQAATRDQLAHADVVMAGRDVPEWDDRTWAYLRAHFRRTAVLQGPGHAAGQVWVRTLP